MITCTRRIEIDAGHRLLNHESKCAHLHGHRYGFDITVTAAALDSVGRVLDFGCIKEVLGTWLDETWDHAFIVQQGDPLTEWLVDNDQKHDVLPCPPTAENLARLVGEAAQDMLDPGIKVVSVVCHETPNCQATWTAS